MASLVNVTALAIAPELDEDETNDDSQRGRTIWSELGAGDEFLTYGGR
jgi:hypothetical protein